MNLFYILYILLSFPLLSFILILASSKNKKINGDFIGITSTLSSFLLSFMLLTFSIISPHFKFKISNTFLPSLTKNIANFSLSFDRLTGLMLVIVSLVSLLVHIFSISYMKGDKHYKRYYAMLSLFTFSMLGLVLSANLLTLYIFWELVGFCSYALIGHYFEKKEATNAAIKAFITTRVGDFGMLIGIFICYFAVGSLEFSDIYSAIFSGNFNGSLRTIVGISLFIGAMGKSAQFPLHVWLPDAMQGPTPVSALIHAATMVAAGVYLLVRLFFIFDENTLLFIAYIGAFTAIFAASIALMQDDIKKVLAYSTISQLGLMVLAAGVASYTSSMFHLLTHAFFKSGLFLGAGAIIYAFHHEQSMKEFGGLYKKFPFLTICYLCFTLSLCGFPFFAGFYSKDLIMGDILYYYKLKGHFFFLLSGVLTTFLTSLYMFRQFFIIFLGTPKNIKLFESAKKIPFSMVFPLTILALLSIFAGGFNFSWFNIFFNHSDAIFESSSKILLGLEKTLLQSSHNKAILISTIASLLGFVIAFLFFFERKANKTFCSAKKVKLLMPNLARVIENKYYIDEFYKATILKLVYILSKACDKFDKYVIDKYIVQRSVNLLAMLSKVCNIFDRYVIDRVVNSIAISLKKLSNITELFDKNFVDNFCVLGISRSVKKHGEYFSLIQTGNVRDYIFYSFLAVIFGIGIIIGFL
ncbi:MAG: NADH-quinone oxidoreductase subunit L [Bdellovibrionota bacterium]